MAGWKTHKNILSAKLAQDHPKMLFSTFINKSSIVTSYRKSSMSFPCAISCVSHQIIWNWRILLFNKLRKIVNKIFIKKYHFDDVTIIPNIIVCLRIISFRNKLNNITDAVVRPKGYKYDTLIRIVINRNNDENTMSYLKLLL